MDAFGSALPIIIIILAFYFLIIRRTQSQQRHAREVQASLKPGIEVMTSSGLYGTITSVEDDIVILEVAPGVSCRWARQAVAQIVTPAGSAGTEPADTGENRPDPGHGGLGS